MKPLAYELIHQPGAFASVLSNVSEGDCIGFFLDSKKSEIKSSGLLDNPDAIMRLDSILGNRATLFYVDPRSNKASVTSYSSAVAAFSSALLGANLITFRVEPPCLLLLMSRDESFRVVDYLDLDSRGVCLWYSKVEEFLIDNLGARPRYSPNYERPSEFRRLLHYGRDITAEALKASISALVSGLLTNK